MSTPQGNPFTHSLACTFAFWTLRLWLGFRALIAGLEKYAGKSIEKVPLLDEFGEPDISGAMVTLDTKAYGLSHYRALPPSLAADLAAEPLIPGWALSAYSAILGPALILLGLALLAGFASRITLFLMGLVYTSLTIGLILLKQDAGVAWLAIHIIMVVAALKLVEHNRLSILSKW
jgi:thiosulfate dehydrogenase [quinone] large subunit